MKGFSQLQLLQAIRKPLAPAVRVERPMKGRGYRRRGRNGKIYGQTD